MLSGFFTARYSKIASSLPQNEDLQQVNIATKSKALYSGKWGYYIIVFCRGENEFQ